MFVLVRLVGIFYLILNLFILSSLSVTPPRDSKKEMHRAMNAGIRSLNFDSDEEQSYETRMSLDQSEPGPPPRGLFSDDDDDEGRGGSSTGTSSGISAHSTMYRRPSQLKLSDGESDDESSHMSATSGIGSDSLSIDQSDSDRSRSFFDQSMSEENGGTLVGLESPRGRQMRGGTPTLELMMSHSKVYSRNDWSEPNEADSITPEASRFPSAHAIHLSPTDDFISPTRNGPLGSGPVASLDELYQSPIGSFNLDRNLWPQEDRRYIKAPKPPAAPGSVNVGLMSVQGRSIPQQFLRAVEFGRKHHNQALSSMKWKKTFVSGNSATVYGIELNGRKRILKITKHYQNAGLYHDDISQCVEEEDILSLQQTDTPCYHKPKHGLIETQGCSALPQIVPFEYYIAEKVTRMHGLLPAAASVPKSFGKDADVWYLIFEELPGISPLKYGENILERLAKPLIRQQLEALEKMATCHIMHLDAHWGNILYSRERGIQLIDFGMAMLVDRFELPNYKASLIITFTLDRCLDCEASRLGRDFQQIIKDENYPIQVRALLRHPWLQYD